MKISLSKSIYLAIFLCLGTNLSTAFYYVIFFVLLIIAAVDFVRHPKIPYHSLNDKIALSFVLVWIYGVIIGFLRGNDSAYILANFAGMSCYIFYFFLVKYKCKIDFVIKILLWCGLILSIYSIIRIVSFLCGFSLLLFESSVGISSTGQLRVYFTTLSVAYVLLGLSLYCLLEKTTITYQCFLINSRLMTFVCFLASVTSIFFMSSSKGFMLGGVMILFMIPFCLFLKRGLFLKMHRGILVLILFVACIALFLYNLDYFTIFEAMFDSEDSSNEVRYEQLDFLLDDCCLLGRGLGAIVPGSLRSEDAPYGFELTYINLIHKFGIFSLFLFANWLYMYIKLFYNLINRVNVFYSICAVSALGYMFPSIGNPLLMHPSMVMLNCISLYIIRVLDEKKKNIRLYGNI